MILMNDIEVFPHREKTETVSEWLESREARKNKYTNKFKKVSKDKKYYLDDIRSIQDNRESGSTHRGD